MYMDTFDEYGKHLYELGKENEKIVVIDCDLGQACRTGKFRINFQDRYVNVGIAEQNAFGVAAGLASSGFIPIVHTFATFACLRGIEQIRNSIALTNQNVKIIGARPGITNAILGATHHAIEDIGIMTSIPNIAVLAPYDYCEVKECLEEAIKYNGPVYIRLDKIQTEKVNHERFKIGKAQLISDGEDITLIGVGDQVINCINAEKKLKELGYSVRVINISSAKPLDKDIILESANKTKNIIVIESHNVIGGVGSEICRVLSEECPTKVKTMGIRDCFTQTGDYEDLLKYYGIDSESIIKEALKILR